MMWFDYILIAMFAIGAISTVTIVGQPRKPIDGGTAAWVVIVYGALIVGIVLTRT